MWTRAHGGDHLSHDQCRRVGTVKRLLPDLGDEFDRRAGTQVGRCEIGHGSRRFESDAKADIMEGCEHHSCRREKWRSCVCGTSLVGRM